MNHTRKRLYFTFTSSNAFLKPSERISEERTKNQKYVVTQYRNLHAIPHYTKSPSSAVARLGVSAHALGSWLLFSVVSCLQATFN